MFSNFINLNGSKVLNVNIKLSPIKFFLIDKSLCINALLLPCAIVLGELYEILNIIFYNSENSTCPFVCKRWNSICKKSTEYAECTDVIKLINSNDKKFIPDNITILDGFYSFRSGKQRILYNNNNIHISTPYFRKLYDISEPILCEDCVDDDNNSYAWEFQLDDEPTCYDLKRLLNKIAK